jgi:hypothetical protein
MSVVPRVNALNMRLINGNGIIAIADLQVTAWGVTLLRCFWKRENGRDRIRLPCNGIAFQSDGDAHRFQQAALAAMRMVAKKMLEEPAQ